VNSGTGFLTAIIGDFFCQVHFENADIKTYDYFRTGEMGLIRAFIMSPILAAYYPRLNALLPGQSIDRVVGRVLIDQLVGSPITLVLTFGAASLMRGTPERFPTLVQEQFVPAWTAGASYWPFIHFFNFKFAPIAHQPLVAHVASVYWNMILSHKAYSKLSHEKENVETK
jgi:Mpv17 / PMP22 family